MMNETHHAWTDQLSDYLDGALTGGSRDAVAAHLAECGECRRVLADLRAVVTEAGRLEGVAPMHDLWPGIASAIGAPSVASDVHGGDVIRLSTERRVARPAGVFLTLRQLAAASIALVLVSAAATLWAGPGLGTAPARDGAAPPAQGPLLPAATGVGGPSPELSAELQTLERSLDVARRRLEPNTVRILEKNLGVIQRAIDESRRALELDPGNAFLRDHLDRAYRDKADYLRQAAGLADWAS